MARVKTSFDPGLKVFEPLNHWGQGVNYGVPDKKS
jgi:hypothetical protein